MTDTTSSGKSRGFGQSSAASAKSDALVFFGATGDLAYKKIFPALQSLVQRGQLQVPAVGWIGRNVELTALDESQCDEMEAYARLLGDAMAGDPLLFARQDSVEAAWEIVQPIVGTETPVYLYEPGTWGPHEADRLAAEVGGWHCPNDPS
jgi:glucose-6-phosphate 1-dehydrogenase